MIWKRGMAKGWKGTAALVSGGALPWMAAVLLARLAPDWAYESPALQTLVSVTALAAGVAVSILLAIIAMRGRVVLPPAWIFAIGLNVGFAGLWLAMPAAWGGEWWLGRIGLVLALIGLLSHVAAVFIRAEGELKDLRDELELFIERRTLQLQAEIEERKYMEKALLEAEQRARDMAEAASDWLWEMGPDLRFSFVSDSLRNVLGVAPDYMVGRPRSSMLAPGEDPGKWRTHFEDLAERRPFRDFEFRFAHPDGSIRHVRISGKPVWDQDGNFVGYRGTGSDISELVRREEALKESERTKNAILEATDDSVIMMSPDGNCLLVNSAAARRLGAEVEDMIGRNLFDFFPNPVAESRRAHLDEVLRTRRGVQFQDSRDDVWFETSLEPVFDERGEVEAVVAFAHDITTRKESEREIRELAAFPEQSPEPVLRVSGDGVLLYANPMSELLLEDWNCRQGEVVPERIRLLGIQVLAGGGRREVEVEAGSLTFSLLFSPAAASGWVNIYGRDVTRWRQAQESLRSSEARAEEAWRRLTEALDSISEAFAMFDPDDRLVLCNARYRETWRLVEDLLRPGAAFGDLIRAEAERGVVRQATGRVGEWQRERIRLHEAGGGMEVQLADGSWWLLSDRRTEAGGHAVVGTDISPLKRREAELRDSEARLAEAQRIARLGSWEWDMARDAVIWSEESLNILGWPSDRHTTAFRSIFEAVERDDRALLRSHLDRALVEETQLNLDVRVKRPNGEIRIIHAQGEVEPDEESRPLRVRGTIQDVTERKRQEADLLQAQKMEAVGQLTGGIAHDFNNILTVMKGNLELLRDHLPKRGPKAALLSDIIDDALSAASQGTHLTGGLLAFARRDPVEPGSVDTAAAILRMSGLLRRTLHSIIEIRTEAKPGLPPAGCDERLLETAILNLALNARDAMPKGGVLILSTDLHQLSAPLNDLPAGEYIAVSVADSGTGIAPEIVDRIFEPLFTTKMRGKGTGLGLRMVDLFARQSGGRILLESTVGQGTKVTLLLPRASAETVSSEAGKNSRPALPAIEGEMKVLLVDDDPKVRRFARRCLTGMGFFVHEAESAAAVLKKPGDIGDFDLVFSDILMPGGVSGVDLVRELRRIKGDLPLILASGSAAAVAEAEAAFNGSIPILRKPYSPADVAAAVATALGRVIRK